LSGIPHDDVGSQTNQFPGNDWVKKTCAQRETLPIAGFALKENRFDGLYVGRQRGKDLMYAGGRSRL
jgi:bifunctional non-homologous end joining protein LigD